MSRYKFRKDFKVSSAEGIDKIPADWEVKQVRYLLLDGADGIKIGPFGSALKLEDMVENGYAVYGQENVIKKNFSLGKRKISAIKFQEMSVYQIFPQDILITMMGTSGKCEIVPDDVLEGIIDSHLLRVRVKDDQIIPEYFKLLVDESPEIFYQMKVFGKGSIMHGLNSGIVKSLKLPLPSVGEQKEILGFLDHETAKIDSLIEKQQKLIELLKEKRQAVISHAVTKGLNPDVPIKDSGVEWLGQIPEHWEVAKVKYLSKIISKGTTPTTMGGDFVTEGVRFLKAENIGKSPTVNPFPEFYITENVDAQLARSRLEENDVLVIIAGATTGLSSVLQKDLLPANTNQAVSFIRPKEKAYAKWISYWLSTQFAQSLIWMGAVQAAQPNLSMENLGNINITLPSVEEIEQLLTVVDRKLSQIDKLIQRNIKAIELIKERRTALISSAVTGKIDVRNWQNPQQDLAV